MEKKSYTVAIDLGSSNVVVAVGSKREDGTLGIEAVVSKPVEGVKAGRIDNIEQAGNAIREAVAEVESTLGVRITEAYAGISGEFVRCARHTDHVFTYDPQNGVNQGDVDALFDRTLAGGIITFLLCSVCILILLVCKGIASHRE